jgi:DNA-binding XRE family transcriptional regulator
MHRWEFGPPRKQHAAKHNDLDLEFDRWGHMTNDSYELLWQRFRRFDAILDAVKEAGYDWWAVEPLGYGDIHELEKIEREELSAEERPAFQRAVGSAIVAERHRLRLRMEDLARAVGVSQPTMCRIESGRRAVRINELGKIAEVLRRPPSWFVASAEEDLRR